MTTAFIFPGQGSQSIGMGLDLYENFETARHVFQEVDDALSLKLSEMIFRGDAADLNLTENTQPALMAVSVAMVRTLAKDFDFNLKDNGLYVAGHSLGEYSALTSVNALTLSDCARALKTRGQAMQKAVPVGQGAMAAILGLDMDAVIEIASEAARLSGAVCECANDNSPGQVVISGAKAAIDQAIIIATERGAKRALLLPVSAPFHCSMMQPAADVMRDTLADINFQTPDLPVIANISVQPETDDARMRDLLVQQVTGQVRWTETINWMAQNNVTRTVEIGAGKVLSGLVKRINKEVTPISLQKAEDLEVFVKEVFAKENS